MDLQCNPLITLYLVVSGIFYQVAGVTFDHDDHFPQRITKVPNCRLMCVLAVRCTHSHEESYQVSYTRRGACTYLVLRHFSQNG